MTPTTRRSKGRPLKFLLAAAAVAGIAVAVNEGLHWWNHVYEPNARVEATFTILASSVNGIVSKIHVQEGDIVDAGVLLANMDASVAELDQKSIEADLARERALRKQIEDELAFFRTDLGMQIRTAEEAVTLTERERSALTEMLKVARSTLEESNKLYDITNKLLTLETRIQTREAEIAELKASKSREQLFKSRLDVVDRNIEKLEIQLARSRQQLKDMHIYSPHRAIINEVSVIPGTYVEDGDPVFLVHDPKAVWIDANIDESDIRHVRPGQRVIVDIDAYPFEHFEGVVRSIGRVTLGSINGNETGRSSSGAQKIPVTIDFDPRDRSVWPGMRAAVNIAIRD